MTQTRPGGKDYLMLIGLGMIWGSSFLFIKLAIATLPPASLTALRMVVATIVLLPLALWAGEKLPHDLRTWALVAVVSLFGTALPFTLISWGEERIDSGLAAILMGGMPLYTLLLAHFFSKDEPLTLAKFVGVIFGLIGLVILIGPAKLLQMGGDTLRQLAVAAAALCYAINAVLTKSLLHLPRLAAAAAIMLAATVMMVPIALAFEQPLSLRPDAAAIGSTVLLGAAHTALATLMMMKLLSSQGAGFFGQINLLVPLFGVVWGVMFLSEPVTVNQLIALFLILLGVAIARGLTRPVPISRQP